MSQSSRTVAALRDVATFSSHILGRPLRPYQLAAIEPVLHSVLHQQGEEFVWIFARQAGKNEALAQLTAYLLNLFQRKGGHIVHTAPTEAQTVTGRQRLQQHLNNALNQRQWRPHRHPARTSLHNAHVLWLSGHPYAHARGATAHHLLIIDEAQDFHEHMAESIFAPMCAATNATRLYIGTAKTPHTYLAHKRRAGTIDGARRPPTGVRL